MNDELYDWMIRNAPDLIVQKLIWERKDAGRGWRKVAELEAQLTAQTARADAWKRRYEKLQRRYMWVSAGANQTKAN